MSPVIIPMFMVSIIHMQTCQDFWVEHLSNTKGFVSPPFPKSLEQWPRHHSNKPHPIKYHINRIRLQCE